MEESDDECMPIILKTINGQVDLISLRKNGILIVGVQFQITNHNNFN